MVTVMGRDAGGEAGRDMEAAVRAPLPAVVAPSAVGISPCGSGGPNGSSESCAHILFPVSSAVGSVPRCSVGALYLRCTV